MGVGAPHHLRQLHLAVVAPVLVRLVQAGAKVLLVLQHPRLALHLVLEAHPLNFAAAAVAAAASGSGAGAFAGELQLLETQFLSSPAAGLSVLAHPVALLAAAGEPLLLHPQAGVGKRAVLLAVPGQAA